MTRHFIIAALSALILASCSPSAPKKAAEKAGEINKLETELKESSKKNAIDTGTLKKLLKEYDQYANTFPADSLTPIYLMKSAKFFDYFMMPDSAIQLYNKIYTQYPNFPKANVALFSEAFIYNNEKHDLPKAKALYNEYLGKYPNTPLAKSAAIELFNLGKTPEQIMAEMDSVKQKMKDGTAAPK